MGLVSGIEAFMNVPRDGQWFGDVVGRFEGPLVLYATRLLGGDVDRARDVVQDTFVKVWQAPGSSEGGPDPSMNGHLAAWLYRVCRNACMDVVRKERRMTTLASEHEVIERSASAPDACDSSPAISTLMQSLPDSQQEALRLKFQAGLSYAEIAKVMEITVNHVGVLIHTALKTIREQMKASEMNLQGERQLR
jgi:RNA polymerase sigma-70 factor (ECF subfamily)